MQSLQNSPVKYNEGYIIIIFSFSPTYSKRFLNLKYMKDIQIYFCLSNKLHHLVYRNEFILRKLNFFIIS